MLDSTFLKKFCKEITERRIRSQVVLPIAWGKALPP